MKRLLILLACGMALSTAAQRTILSLNEDWQFAKATGPDSLVFHPVRLPHTWNIDDVMDDAPGYYRGPGIYRRTLNPGKSDPNRNYYLQFEGANQETEVWVNGQKAGTHIGGYTGFQVNIGSLLKFDQDNKLEVRVNNRFHPDIAPLTADFTFYGGIYRDVWLVSLPTTHFAMDKQAPGIRIQTPLVNEKRAVVQASLSVQNENARLGAVRVRAVLTDVTGKQVGVAIKRFSGIVVGNNELTIPRITVSRPQLWSPAAPNRYRLQVTLLDDASGRELDQISQPVGFRWFKFDADRGFFLNGNPLKLVGTSRHQDFPGRGNALPDSMAVADVLRLKEMGGNFLRVAHYPQDPAVLAACDSLGILASVEIPIVNEITVSDAFFQNALQMQLEMIRQNYNHPSVVIWCYMNEVLLRPPYGKDAQKEAVYLKALRRLAGSLDSLTRAEDPSRYTMIAHHASYALYKKADLIDLPMIVGWNLYSGWYGGKFQDFPTFLDSFHRRHPRKPMVVSEYGADADPRIRSRQPVRFDKSIEYTLEFHQHYWAAMRDRPFVAAAMIWNLADFNSETRSETMPHINNKGLLTWGREAKDPYYYYQAVLSKTPTARIIAKDPVWAIPNPKGEFDLHRIVAVTNTSSLQLWVNEQWIGTASSKEGICEWKVPMAAGWNQIRVSNVGAGPASVSDTAQIWYQQVSIADTALLAGRTLHFLLGGNRFYTDQYNNSWVPDQPYRSGSWGHRGGKAFLMPGNDRLPYGTDKNIRSTNDDPIYQTQQTGIQEYQADLPPGSYEVSLHFAELSGVPSYPLPYNLSEEKGQDNTSARVFNVYINEQLRIERLNLAEQYGRAVAVVKTFSQTIPAGGSLRIRFEAIEGEPVLNAIQIRRIN